MPWNHKINDMKRENVQIPFLKETNCEEKFYQRHSCTLYKKSDPTLPHNQFK
jgi:hypothetical protein